MNISPEKGYSIAENAILNTGKDARFHKNYKRVVSLAKLYKQLITGQDIDSLLEQFVRREDGELFKQRKRITQVITPAVASAIRNPFYGIDRVNNINYKINFADTKEDKNRAQKIQGALNKYYGTKSLEQYSKTRFVDLTFTDPNSFIVTEFDPIETGPSGEMLGLPQSRPFEVSSSEAINFEYKNNELKWLLVELPCKYKTKDAVCNGKIFTIYAPIFTIKYTQIDAERFSTSVGYSEFQTEAGAIKIYKPNDNSAYLVELFEHKSDLIPAFRVGYKMDLYTENETCVNPFHDALCYFLKSIKTVSEFDLTMCLHAFPKLFQYVNRCGGVSSEIVCNGGKTIEGNNCSKCNGTGIAIHSSAQDAVIMRVPTDKEDMIDLSKMIHTESLDIALPDFQNKYIKELKNDAYVTVFDADQVQTPSASGPATATEVIITADNKNNTVRPFANQAADFIVHQAKVTAYYLDEPKAIIIYKFPKNLKFKTTTELMTDLKLANESNAPGYVRRELSAEISEAQFVDKPEELVKIRTKELFYPFPDKTDTEILFIIGQNKTTLYNEILWANFDNIFSQLELEAEEIEQYFYDYEPKKQKDLIKIKVDEIILQIQSEAAGASVNFDSEGGAAA